MNLDALRAAYHQEQRFEAKFPNARRDDLLNVVRYIQVMGRQLGWVLWSDLNADTADAAIQEQIAYFEQLGQDFLWKVYDYDLPADLSERLVAAGFEAYHPPDAIMVLDMQPLPEILRLPVPESIRRVTAADMPGVVALLTEVWHEDFSGLAAELTELMGNNPETLSMYAAEVGGQVVSAAWIQYLGGSRFAGLWGGSTLEAYRELGLYTGLLAARAHEAYQRGIRFLTVDASPMSRPILERHDFVCIATATACLWRAGCGVS